MLGMLGEIVLEKKNKLYVPVKTAAVAIITAFCCVLLLVITACIPTGMIQKQSEASAEYFSQREPFEVLIGDYINSIQDNYSDTVICDIIYCIDTKTPFKSVISAKYTQSAHEQAYDGYLAAVRGEEEINNEYGRYWHGTMVLLRPLLVFVPVQLIRVIFGVLITILQIAVICILVKRKHIAFSVIYGISVLLVEPWMFFTSFEYSTAFLVASAAALIILLLKGRESDDVTMPFFAAVGVVIFFMDFLTTENLTFTLPMMMLLLDRHPSYSGKEGFISILKNGICWALGYAGMFFLKVVLLLVVAGKEVVASSVEEGFFRIGGEVRLGNSNLNPAADPWTRFSGAIWHNLSALYPETLGELTPAFPVITTGIILAVGFSLVYLLRDKIDWNLFIPLGIVALIPYARFLALSNHSYVHFFITYRAQLVTIAVFIFFVFENGIRQIFSGRK
jgi:hypothetical protein